MKQTSQFWNHPCTVQQWADICYGGLLSLLLSLSQRLWEVLVWTHKDGNVCALLRKLAQWLLKNADIVQDAGLPLLHVYAKGWKAEMWTDIYTPMLMAEGREQSMCLSFNRWNTKCSSAHRNAVWLIRACRYMLGHEPLCLVDKAITKGQMVYNFTYPSYLEPAHRQQECKNRESVTASYRIKWLELTT